VYLYSIITTKEDEEKPQRYYDLNYRDGMVFWPDGVREPMAGCFVKCGKPVQAWDIHWDDLSEFFKYSPEIRRAIYTTNAIESLNYRLRKVTKNRSTRTLVRFVNDDAIYKIMYLAIRNASEKWTMPIRDWGTALNQFSIEFGNERVPFK
jgi:transposase-like protein